MEENTLRYHYHFHQGDTNSHFEIRLDKEDLFQVHESPTPRPDWTRLDHHQCSHCPLSTDTTEYCPAAVSIAQVVEQFKDIKSNENIEVVITTPERTISAKTSVQEAASPLIGLLMATSDCPYTYFLRPLARFHTPLASEEETIIRTSSMYLLAQYFRANKNMSVDTELKKLGQMFLDINKINGHLAKRIRSASDKDASVNALVLLDLLAQAIPFVISDNLQELEYLFKFYLKAEEA